MNKVFLLIDVGFILLLQQWRTIRQEDIAISVNRIRIFIEVLKLINTCTTYCFIILMYCKQLRILNVESMPLII